MNAKKSVDSPVRMPVHRYLSNKIDMLKMGSDGAAYQNAPIAAAVGFSSPNVISMLKMGKMQMPTQRIKKMADYLHVDPMELLDLVMRENNPELWDAITGIIGRHMVKENEWRLVKWMREETDGAALNFMDSEKFKAAMTKALASLMIEHEKAVNQDDALVQSERAKRKAG
jgi:hypothetical protein